jgi:hypothetical protein
MHLPQKNVIMDGALFCGVIQKSCLPDTKKFFRNKTGRVTNPRG